MLYVVKNKFGCVVGPMRYEDIRNGERSIAEFNADGFYTDEENFERFAEFVKEQEGKSWTIYNAEQLKELYNMWRESLQ